jgi:predicted CoA-binding protein
MSGDCELPDFNPPDEEIARFLSSLRTVALVGASEKPDRPSHRVGAFLIDRGYTVHPVNPRLKKVFGRPCYPDLNSLPFKPGEPGEIDVVDVFRRPEAIPSLVDEAIALGARCVWMQLGLAHNQAADKARKAGLLVVMNKCLKIEIERLGRNEKTKTEAF